MSIASEITRIQGAKSDLATAIAAKGVTVPAATKLDGYASLVSNIPMLKLYTMRPDAELVKTYTGDRLLITDDGVTMPEYKTTSATTLLAAANLSGTVTLDYDNYDWFILERFLTAPVYSTATPAKSRNEFSVGSICYELVNIPANSFKAANGTLYASRSVAANVYSCYRMLYWSTSAALGVYTSTTYGVHQVVTAPTISSGKLTIKAPSVQFRGSTSYLTEDVYNTITDIRRQYHIEVYKAPKGNLNIDGWGLQQQAMKIIGDVTNNNGVLT